MSTPNNDTARSALFEMETPLRDALNLSRAMRMASAGVGQNDQDRDGDALYALATQVIAAIENVDAIWNNTAVIKQEAEPEPRPEPKPRAAIALVQPSE